MYGPSPYDDTRAVIGEDTPFFLSDQSWYEVLWVPPQGNAYDFPVHAYLAAQLNSYSGADTSVVTVQLGQAAALPAIHTPADVGAMRGNDPVRQQFICLAEVLDSFDKAPSALELPQITGCPSR